jgi:hypothetical protein
MRLKNVLLFLAVAFAGYMAYGYAVLHFNQASMVYKNFADAVLRDEPDKARLYVADAAALEAFKYAALRRKYLGDGDVKLTYYSIDHVYFSNDGNAATIEARQISRVDPPGSGSVFGKTTVTFSERTQLEKVNGIWKVKHYEDDLTRNHGV